MAMALPRGPLTLGDLADLPDDGHRYELIDGTLLSLPQAWTDPDLGITIDPATLCGPAR